MKVLDLTNKDFGRLKVLERVPNPKDRRVLWKCSCSCGEMTVVISQKLRIGETRSCGCLQRELSKQRAFKHGCIALRSYSSWKEAKTRCFNPKSKDFKNYGGRGITMCSKWRNSFVEFLNDMGDCPEGHSIDRIDVNGNYEPGNCRWATAAQQARNKRKRA